MMEDDNRVYLRAHGKWRVLDPGVPLGVTPPNGWPHIPKNIERKSEMIVWRGKLLKDRWNTFDREEFLEEISGLG